MRAVLRPLSFLLAAAAAAAAAEPAATGTPGLHGAAWLLAAVSDEWPPPDAVPPAVAAVDGFLLAQARLCAAGVRTREGASAGDWLAALDAALALPVRPVVADGRPGLFRFLSWNEGGLLAMESAYPYLCREGTLLPLLRRLPDPDRWPEVRAGIAERIAAVPGGATNAPPVLQALAFALARLDGDGPAASEALAALDATPVLRADPRLRRPLQWLLDHPGKSWFEREEERGESGGAPAEPADAEEDPGDFVPAPSSGSRSPLPAQPVDEVWAAIREGRHADAERAGFALFSRKDAHLWGNNPSRALLELYRRAGTPADVVAFCEGNPLWRGKDVLSVDELDAEDLAAALLGTGRTNDAVRIARAALFELGAPPDWTFGFLRENLPPAEALDVFASAAVAFPCDPRPTAAVARVMSVLARPEIEADAPGAAGYAAEIARSALATPPLVRGADGDRLLADALVALGEPVPGDDDPELFDAAEEAFGAGRTNEAARLFANAFARLAAGYGRTVPFDAADAMGWWDDDVLAAAWRALPALAGEEVEPPRGLPAWADAVQPEPLADPAARAGAHFLLGLLLEGRNRPRAAFGQYRKALALEPRYADAALAALDLAEDPEDRAGLERTLARLGAVPAVSAGSFESRAFRAIDAKALLAGAAAARRRLPPPEDVPVLLLGENAVRNGKTPTFADTPDDATHATAAAAEFAELVALLRIAAGRRGGHPLPADHVFAFGTWPGALADWLSLSVR